MKFLGTTTKAANQTTCDGVEDPRILSAQLLNTKKSFRLKGYTHVRISEIGTFCPREYAIGYQLGSKKESYVEFATQQQFDLGSALHYWYQNGGSKVFKDVLHGWWFCLSCQQTRKNKDGTNYFGLKPTTKCNNCGAHPAASQYQEFFFRIDNPYRVVGKIDGVIKKDNVYRFCDLKSFWKKPDSGFPAGNDVTQIASYAHFYNFVPEEQKFPVPIDTSTVYLHYISKKFSYSDSLPTYQIKPTQKMIDLIVKRVKDFTDSTITGVLPEPFEQCVRNKFEKGRAKDCFLKNNCLHYYQEGK